MTSRVDPTVLRDDLEALQLLAVETFTEDCLAASPVGDRFRQLYASGDITYRLSTVQHQGRITLARLVAVWPEGREETVFTIEEDSRRPP